MDPRIKIWPIFSNSLQVGLFLDQAVGAASPRTLKTHLPFSLMPPRLLDTCKVSPWYHVNTMEFYILAWWVESVMSSLDFYVALYTLNYQYGLFVSSTKNLATLSLWFINLHTERVLRFYYTFLSQFCLPLRLLFFSSPLILSFWIQVVYVARNPRDVCVSYYFHQKLGLSARYMGNFEEFVDFWCRDLGKGSSRRQKYYIKPLSFIVLFSLMIILFYCINFLNF